MVVFQTQNAHAYIAILYIILYNRILVPAHEEITTVAIFQDFSGNNHYCVLYRTSSGRDYTDDSMGETTRPRSNSLNDDCGTLTRSNSSPDVTQLPTAYSIDNTLEIPEHVLKIYRADQSYKYFLVHKVCVRW